MTDLTTLDAAELAGKIHSREVSSVEVTQAHLDRIAAVDTEYHAFLHVAGEQALEAAAAVDNSLAGGNEPASALAGVPIALKDIFTTTDMPTTCASKILEGWVAPYDATLTSKLRAAGIPILGKTNLDEFAMGSSTENSAFGPTRNPWDVTRIPGGSGGGSAAALASRQAPLAIGTDTGGSIRQPAAVTATVGTKPTYGTVSRFGLVACASSLDQGGPCGRTVLDTALLHEVIAGHDPRDSTSIDAPVRPVVAAAREGAAGDLRGVKSRCGQGTSLRQLPARRHRFLRRCRRATQGFGCRSCRGFVPELRACARVVLPGAAQRGLVQPGSLRRHALRTACRRRQHECRPGHGGNPRRRFRSGGQAPHHDRYLRTVLGLLRRLLRFRRSRSVRSSRAISTRPTRRWTYWSRRPARSRRGSWGRRSAIRWPCTSRTCARCRPTWPDTARCRSHRVCPRTTTCRWDCRSWRPPWLTSASTVSVRPTKLHAARSRLQSDLFAVRLY